MNFNASFQATLNFERPDQICQFEWGYWPETLDRWRAEGMIGEPWEALPITFYHRAPIETRIFPPFEERVLSETATTRTIRNSSGVVLEQTKTATSMPHFIEFPVKNLGDFERLKERLDGTDPKRFSTDWPDQARKLAARNSILVLGNCEISFFGWHRDLMGVENLLMAFYDQPELIHAISRHHLSFIKDLYSRVMKDVKGDFVFVWEDMSYKNGPLISPALVREFMLPYYRELVAFFRSHGDYKFLLDSDGDVTQLIPLFAEVGIDGMLPFEVAAGMDIRRIAEQYPSLIICGGLDKREIAKGPGAIDRELEAKLPAMFRRGGYFPSMDHHVPPEVSYADFQYYLQKTRELYEKHGRGS
jgi:uroporphyrinogen decarboxylase